jgi:hypothetical protein
MAERPPYRKILGPPPDSAGFHYESIPTARTVACAVTSATGPLCHPLPPDAPALRYLVVQLMHRAGDPVLIAVTVRNTAGAAFRLQFCSPGRRTPATPKKGGGILIDEVPPDQWTNLCFDIQSLALRHQPGCAYEAVDSIEISPTCVIRWVFLAKTPLSPSAKGADLPNPFKFVGTLASQTVVVTEGVSTPKRSRIPVLVRPRVDAGKRADGQDQTPSRAMTFEDDFLADEPEVEAFAGTPPIPAEDHGEEEELELVFIDALGCYYCPDNQKYYQVDEDRRC